ncbi:TadE family protein [Brevibacillus choshinensis]|uniref:TadE family protein n=1 Tax=Brevibacillus choshinensis TaxID=54911 RepID=UPI002E1A7292|nr:pilus assembly protein [Brevibacillus choshinensis]MED4752410.1 pilus assembly protein [Brevibacillus choshinensis]MED4785106.1 pilus assembly protein [Brevibacillus choshinensis]
MGRINGQKGSATVEFLGILPFVFLILLILWQFLSGVYAVIIAQSAANEAAKVYAITGKSIEALDAAQKIVGSAGGGIAYNGGGSGISGDGSYFTAKVGVHLDLFFLPDFIKRNMDEEDRVISFSRELRGRVIH